MRLSATVERSGSPAETAAWAAAMESAGMDVLWVGEAYGFDAVSMLGYLAAKTTNVQLGTGILPVFSRSPALTAMTAAGLDFMSSGRFILGLGASGPQVVRGWYGVPYDRPLARTREIIEVCRTVWAGQKLDFAGETFQVPAPAGGGEPRSRPLKMLNRPFRAGIPIYVAALGPKNVSLAAQLAEGWMPFFFHPDRADVWSEALGAGKAARDPEQPALEIVAGGPVAICDESDAERMRDAERAHVALYVGGMGSAKSNFYNDLFVRYGYEAEAERIQSLYLSGAKTEAEALVPSDYLRATSLVGDEGHIRDRIAAYRTAGVTCLNLDLPRRTSDDDAVKLVEKVRSWCD